MRILFLLPLAATVAVAHAQRVRDAAPARPLSVITQPRHGTSPVHYEPPVGDAPDHAPPALADAPDGRQPRALPVRDQYVLAFSGGSHRPAPGVDPRLANVRERAFYGYVMLYGSITARRKLARLEALGVRRLGAHTWQCWAAEIPTAAVKAIAALPFVRWVGLARPEQKLDPRLAESIAAAAPGDRLRIDVSVFDSDLGARTSRTPAAVPERSGSASVELAPTIHIAPNGPMHRALTVAGLEFESYTEIDNVYLFRGRATPAAVRRIRDLGFVAFVEPVVPVRGHDDSTHSMMLQDAVRGTWGGAGVTVGIIDSGISLDTRHRDFDRKFFVAWDNVGTGGNIDEHGHGTGVTGVALGEGVADQRYRGAAPTVGRAGDERVFIGRLLDKDNRAVGNSSTLFDALGRDYRDMSGRISPKPRVINNSWGATPSENRPWIGSEANVRVVDGNVYFRRQVYVFSAGNGGPNRGSGRPGIAKNALTVGNVHDNWPDAIRPGDLAVTSAGGTADNRRKPEILAPGRFVTTTRRASRSGYSQWQGTSFAAPHVTGAVASLMDHHPALELQPAQVKALLCAAAEWQGSAGQTSGWFGTRLGYGLVNCSKAHGDAETVWFSGTATGPFTRSGNWTYWDLQLPSTIKHLSLVLAWDEPAVQAGATAAVDNQLLLIADVWPYDAAGDKGDIVIQSGASNLVSRVGQSLANQLAGKRVRIKAYGKSIKVGAKVGMAALWMLKTPQVQPALSIQVTKSILRPGETIRMQARLSADANGHAFDNAVISPVLPNAWTVTQMRRVGLDNAVMTYTDTSHVGDPYPSLTGGMTVGAGRQRDLMFWLKAPGTSNWYQIAARAWVDPGDRTLTDRVAVCVDGLGPAKVTGLTSSSHFENVWSKSKTLHMIWNRVTDNGCSGIAGFGIRIGKQPEVPQVMNAPGDLTMRTSPVIASPSGLYYNLRAFDKAGNPSPHTATWGPFFVDDTKPILQSVSINQNATHTKSLDVDVRVSASDTNSGVANMRFSSNGTTWSPWRSYAFKTAYDLSRWGGSPGQGTKTVWVEVRDKAGNVSAAEKDTIIYDSQKPIVVTVAINGGADATSSLDVKINVKAIGAPTDMRVSSDGSKWSSWRSYSETPFDYQLWNYGGDTSTGRKLVFFQVRDAAGNLSNPKSNSILYYRVPRIDTLSTPRVPVVHDLAVRLTGQLEDVDKLWVGAVELGQKPEAWLAGWWERVSKTEIDLHMPQNTIAGRVSVHVANPGFESKKVALTRIHPVARVFHSAPTKRAGATVPLVLHRGSFPANGIAVMTLSASPLPLVLPGLVRLGHGGNSTTVIDPSFMTLPALGFDPQKRTALWQLPTFRALRSVTLWFQPLLFDPRDPFKAPIETARADSTKLD